MQILKSAIGTCLFLPLCSFADRYGIYDDIDDYPGGGGGFNLSNIFGFILLILGVLVSYGFLFDSCREWKIRRVESTKPNPKDDFTDWLFMVVGYLVTSAFLIIPILFVVKWVESAEVVRENWLWAYLPTFIVLTFFRRT